MLLGLKMRMGMVRTWSQTVQGPPCDTTQLGWETYGRAEALCMSCDWAL